MSEVSTQALHLVTRELNDELNEARIALELFGEQQDQIEILIKCRDHLHHVHGALRMVEVYGAALLVEEMEQLVQYLIDHIEAQLHLVEGLDALLRAMVQLPAYLDRVMAGGLDMALILLPLLNDLRAARGQALLSEGTLLLLNLRSDKQPNPVQTQDAKSDNSVSYWARRMRTRFQLGLLGLIKGERLDQNIEIMARAAARLEQVATIQAVFQLWWVVGAVLEALKEQGLESTASIKRLLGQADRQMKRLYEEGEMLFTQEPPIDLLNNLLYYVARATSQGVRIAAVRKSFRLDELLPLDAQVEAARESLSAPSVKLMKTVATAIAEDLARVKDALDLYVRKDGAPIDSLLPQLELLKKIGDTLGVLGLGELRVSVQHQASTLQEKIENHAQLDEASLMAMASSLISIEDRLDGQLLELVQPSKTINKDELIGSQGVDEYDSEFQQVSAAVLRECIVNVARIKEVIALAMEGQGEAQTLDQVSYLIRDIHAAMVMLGKVRAAAVTERIKSALPNCVRAPLVAATEKMERLADAIVAVEYYLEGLQTGRGDYWQMLDSADQSLRELGLLVEQVPEHALLVQLEKSGKVDVSAVTTATGVLKAQNTTPINTSSGPVLQLELPPVLKRPDDKTDPEFLELFIEEARDEVFRLQSLLPRWEANPLDHEALIGIRRSFHTLKGSGRLVGAQLIGEFAWSIESILNRIISQTLERSPEIVELFQLAIKALPELIEQLEAGRAPEQNIAGLIAIAHAIAHSGPTHSEEEDDAESVVDNSVGDADFMPEPATAIDPSLHDIYAKEVACHLAQIREYLQVCSEFLPPHPITEALHRACHTLSGASKAAGARQGIKLAEPINRYISKLFNNGLPLPEAGLQLLWDAVRAIEQMIEHLDEGTGYFISQTHLLNQLASLEDRLDLELRHKPSLIEVIEPLDVDPLELAPPNLPSELTNQGSASQSIQLDVGQLQDLVDQYGEGFNGPVEPLTDEPDHVTKAHSSSAYVQQAQSQHIVETASWAANFTMPVLQPINDGEQDVTRKADLFSVVDLHQTQRPDGVVLDEGNEHIAADSQFDADIAAIYAEEAMELLEVADRALQAWRKDQADDRRQDELKRTLHTLKGGARMAGIGSMGDLSHELESLMELVERGVLPAQLYVLDLIQSGIDELSRMRDVVSRGGYAPDACSLIDSIRAISHDHVLPSASVLPLEELSHDSVRDRAVAELDLVLDDSSERQIKADSLQQLDRVAETSLGGSTQSDVEQQINQVVGNQLLELPQFSAERGDLARVDAALLDDLLNGAGEVNILRSRMEQQISSLDTNLSELGRTVTRLKDQLRKLEMETEAQILHRHHHDVKNRDDFDPLEMDRYSSIQQFSRALAESVSDVDSIAGLLGGMTGEAHGLLMQQLRVVTELQNGLMKTRMVPFSYHVPRLTRLVRQVAADLGKQVELKISGAGGELDRQVLDRMLPPFEHMLRNSVVHGIESPEIRAELGKRPIGEIHLDLHREGSEMIISIQDDGRGIDVQAIQNKARAKGLIKSDRVLTDEAAVQLILEPGFSTATEVTQHAGRGVGMDVVVTAIKKLGGVLFTENKSGQGVKFTIRLPFTLAISQALLVRVGESELYALPLPTIESIVRLPRAEVLDYLSSGSAAFEYGGLRYKVQYLGAFIHADASILPDGAELSLILIKAGEHSTALLTDEIVGNREVVVKTVGPLVSGIRWISGATILGDGRVVIILDMGMLVRSQWRAHQNVPLVGRSKDSRTFVLVVDDSITVRRVTQRLLERHGMRVLTAKDGIDALEILQEHVPDVILMDIEMPRMDGYELATTIRSDVRWRDVPIVIITSRVGEKHRARALEIGVNAYLGKPYQENQLLDAIEPLVTAKGRLNEVH